MQSKTFFKTQFITETVEEIVEQFVLDVGQENKITKGRYCKVWYVNKDVNITKSIKNKFRKRGNSLNVEVSTQ